MVYYSMCEKAKYTEGNKRKQLSLLDFFLDTPDKKFRTNSNTSSNKKTFNNNKFKSSIKLSPQHSLDAEISSCPNPQLESLDLSENSLFNLTESAPTCMEEQKLSSIDDAIMLSTQQNEDEECSNVSKKENDSLAMDSASTFSSEINEENNFESSKMQYSQASPSIKLLSLGCRYEELTRISDSLNLTALNSTFDHTVLFNATYVGSSPPPSKSPFYKDAWDSYHVRLPCSPKNLYPVKKLHGKDIERRWKLVQSSLLNRISNSLDLEEAILVYNSRYSNQWSFRALHKFFTDDVDQQYATSFFANTLPKMVDLAIMMPQLFSEPIPLLSRQKKHTITMTQQQVACLLCNAFFCTFPWRNSKKSTSEYINYPDINFNRLLIGSSDSDSVVSEKLKMLFHYFDRVTSDMPCGTISFERRCLNEFPLWNQSPCTLGAFHVRSDGMIEKEGSGMLQVDFANRFLGGGVLGLGAVQEEIRFCICPELIVTRLFCEALEDNECIIITGAEQFSCYSGYRDTLKFAGNYKDLTPRDEWRRIKTQIVAIDAIYFNKPSNQYTPANIRRELNKAFCGFFGDESQEQSPAVATGNWGCGAFRGNPILKALIQLMASSASGRDLCYFTFNDVDLVKEIFEMYSFIREEQIKISDLWRILMRYHLEIIQSGATEELFEFIQRSWKSYDELTDESDN